MKAFILTEADFARLIDKLEADPGRRTMHPLDEKARQIYEDAFRFFNYQVRTWIDEVKR